MYDVRFFPARDLDRPWLYPAKKEGLVLTVQTWRFICYSV